MPSYLSFILYALGFVAVQVLLAVFVGRFIRFGMDDKHREPALRDDDTSEASSDRLPDQGAKQDRKTPSEVRSDG